MAIRLDSMFYIKTKTYKFLYYNDFKLRIMILMQDSLKQ